MFDLMSNIMSPQAMIIILVIVLVLFGGSRIPEMMKGLGSGVREFKKGMTGDEEEAERLRKEEEEKRTAVK
jgi:sec-independent protein translocase protein TatA